MQLQWSSPSSCMEKIRRIAETPADICVVGGDFHPDLLSSILRLEEISKAMPVIYVPGNLDFYSMNGDDKTMEAYLSEAMEVADKIGNIHVLSNSSVVIEGTKFIGSTLWGKIDEEDNVAKHRALTGIADFTYMKTVGGKWDIARMNLEHDISVDFIEDALTIDRELPTVVVTHTSPHPSAVNPKYAGDILGPMFNPDLSHILNGPFAPDYWIAGGVHYTGEWRIGNTEVVANGLGHMGRTGPENPDFDYHRTFDVAPRLSAERHPSF